MLSPWEYFLLSPCLFGLPLPSSDEPSLKPSSLGQQTCRQKKVLPYFASSLGLFLPRSPLFLRNDPMLLKDQVLLQHQPYSRGLPAGPYCLSFSLLPARSRTPPAFSCSSSSPQGPWYHSRYTKGLPNSIICLHMDEQQGIIACRLHEPQQFLCNIPDLSRQQATNMPRQKISCVSIPCRGQSLTASSHCLHLGPIDYTKMLLLCIGTDMRCF